VLPIFITNPISILSSVVKVRAAEILQILYDYFNGSFHVLLGYPVSAQMHPIKPPKILERTFYGLYVHHAQLTMPKHWRYRGHRA